MNINGKIAIIGCGNIGSAIATGLVKSGKFDPQQFILTRRKIHLLESLSKQGFEVKSDNKQAVQECKVILLAVEPQQTVAVLQEIKDELNTNKILISIVTGVSTKEINKHLKEEISVVRAMPNTAISVQESMTCLTSTDETALGYATALFDCVGKTLVIDEEQMIPATALGACGIAFFLRAVRSASQGGIEIGFHSKEAFTIAAQTAKGAASLLLNSKNHPEIEIDRVTTPRGCTISGLNEMEHKGFSSALIKGITTSADKAAQLYHPKNK